MLKTFSSTEAELGAVVASYARCCASRTANRVITLDTPGR